MILTSLSVLIFWCILACTFGYIEAYVWHLNATHKAPLIKAENQWLHGFLVFQRTVAILICQIPLIMVSIYNDERFPWVYPLVLFFIFPFFHNGAKYSRRNALHPGNYEKGWWSDPSSTSLAKGNLSAVQRLSSFGAGLAIYIFWLVTV